MILTVGDFTYHQPITDPMHFKGADSRINSLAAHQQILALAKQFDAEVWFDIHVWTEGLDARPLERSIPDIRRRDRQTSRRRQASRGGLRTQRQQPPAAAGAGQRIGCHADIKLNGLEAGEPYIESLRANPADVNPAEHPTAVQPGEDLSPYEPYTPGEPPKRGCTFAPYSISIVQWGKPHGKKR